MQYHRDKEIYALNVTEHLGDTDEDIEQDGHQLGETRMIQTLSIIIFR